MLVPHEISLGWVYLHAGMPARAAARADIGVVVVAAAGTDEGAAGDTGTDAGAVQAADAVVAHAAARW